MEENPINLITANIDFSNNEDYQTIYASQLYGTFFAIYAKLTTSKYTDYYTLNDANLYLVNYKGNLDLGIVQADFFEVKNTENNTVSGGFKIEVQALYQSKPENLKVKNIDTNLKFNTKESFLFVDRRLKRIHPQNDTNDIAIKDGVFDTEFYYRDGYIDNSKYKALKVCQSSKPKEWSDEADNFSIAPGNPKCPRSKMLIL